MQDGVEHDAKRLKANLQGEIDSAALYRALAAAEQSPALQSARRFKRRAPVPRTAPDSVPR